MSIEHELQAMLSERADQVRVDPTRREGTLSSASRGRRFVAATAVGVAASLVVVGIGMAGSVREASLQPAPMERPSEHPEPDEDDLIADVPIAEARDGSWTLFAGADADRNIVCFELDGGGCTATDVRDGFILLQMFNGTTKEGFIYGPVNNDVARLELDTGDTAGPVRLRLRRFPERLGLDDLRFFVRPLKVRGAAMLVARGSDGSVIQEMDIRWGQGDSSSISSAGAVVRTFMQRRVAGAGAERFLDADGRAVFGTGGGLAPLYPEPPMEDFEIVFVDDLGDGTYEVGVRLIFEAGSYAETLFVHAGDDGLVISGGRPGLEGP